MYVLNFNYRDLKRGDKIMKIFKRVLLVLGIIFICIAVGLTSSGYVMYKAALEECSLDKKIKEISEDENYTKLQEMPQMYLDAVIAVEDHRFKDHNGVDVISIGRAVVNDIKAMKLVEGGSTITQQLAKNTYFTQDKKMTRKIAEMFMAWNIEKNCDKNQILELYLNTSYFGDGYYSVKEASKGYFDKEPIDMNDYECTLLAGIPNAPSVYSPTKNPLLARQRQRQVLAKMVKYKYLNQEEADNIYKRDS